MFLSSFIVQEQKGEKIMFFFIVERFEDKNEANEEVVFSRERETEESWTNGKT